MIHIISSCPCCGSNVFVDLNSGELLEAAAASPEQLTPNRGRLEVNHATPEFFVYRDPTHQPGTPVVQPISHPRPTEEFEQVILPELTLQQQEDLSNAVINDLKQRRLI